MYNSRRAELMSAVIESSAVGSGTGPAKRILSRFSSRPSVRTSYVNSRERRSPGNGTSIAVTLGPSRGTAVNDFARIWFRSSA